MMACKVRRSMLRLLLAMSIALQLCACFGPGRGDFHVKLSGGYFLWRNNPVDVKVAPQGSDDNTPIIPATVTHLSYMQNLVFARRASNGNADYWILDTGKPRVYGPLSIDEYKRLLTELKVAPEPTLIDIYELRGK